MSQPAPPSPAGAVPEAYRPYLHDVADRIIEMDGACAHNWLVGVARQIKALLAAPAPAEATHDEACASLDGDACDCKPRASAADAERQEPT